MVLEAEIGMCMCHRHSFVWLGQEEKRISITRNPDLKINNKLNLIINIIIKDDEDENCSVKKE